MRRAATTIAVAHGRGATPGVSRAGADAPRAAQAGPFAEAAAPRRKVLATIVGAASCAMFPAGSRADAAALAAAITAFTGGAAPQPGGVTLDVAQLVENGNSVPVAVRVESPMSAASHVRRIGLVNERNPQPQVAVFHLGPRSGRAAVGTRMRMADSQRVVAVAELSDGSFRRASVEVIVTLAACIGP
jgi:sulfur-oxidizing protein SoxY